MASLMLILCHRSSLLSSTKSSQKTLCRILVMNIHTPGTGHFVQLLLLNENFYGFLCAVVGIWCICNELRYCMTHQKKLITCHVHQLNWSPLITITGYCMTGVKKAFQLIIAPVRLSCEQLACIFSNLQKLCDSE